ncbi:MAG: hypothetical protein ACJA08_001503 [Cyclobacteriaceae bacterium]|jgi:hypothetical protein
MTDQIEYDEGSGTEKLNTGLKSHNPFNLFFDHQPALAARGADAIPNRWRLTSC